MTECAVERLGGMVPPYDKGDLVRVRHKGAHVLTVRRVFMCPFRRKWLIEWVEPNDAGVSATYAYAVLGQVP